MATAGDTGALVEGGHPPSEGWGDSIKLSRNVILKFPMSRKSKPKDAEDSTSSQATKASSGGEGITRPSFSSKDAREFRSLLGGSQGIKLKSSHEEIPASV